MSRELTNKIQRTSSKPTSINNLKMKKIAKQKNYQIQFYTNLYLVVNEMKLKVTSKCNQDAKIIE